MSIQAASISDPRFHSENFEYQPVWVIFEMMEAITNRDMSMANAFSITTAKIGLALAPKDTPLQYFLPFNLEEEVNPNQINQFTIDTFKKGVKDKSIPDKVISALSRYLDQIY